MVNFGKECLRRITIDKLETLRHVIRNIASARYGLVTDVFLPITRLLIWS